MSTEGNDAKMNIADLLSEIQYLRNVWCEQKSQAMTLAAECERLRRENLALRAEVAEAKVRENRRVHDADVERRAFAHVMHIERGGVE